jgi:hypothetical protein
MAGRTLLLAHQETLINLTAPCVHCRHAYAATRRATAPILLSYRWPSTCSRVAGCLARAHACRNEPSRPPVEHSRLHPRMRRFNSARTSGFCTPPPFSTATCCDAIRAGLPPPSVLRYVSNPRHVTPAPGSARARPPRAVAQLLIPLPSALGHLRSSRAARGAARPRPLPPPQRPPTFTMRDCTAPWAGPPRTIALQHLHIRARVCTLPPVPSSAPAPAPACTRARVASHVPQFLHTGPRCFPAGSRRATSTAPHLLPRSCAFAPSPAAASLWRRTRRSSAPPKPPAPARSRAPPRASTHTSAELRRSPQRAAPLARAHSGVVARLR